MANESAPMPLLIATNNTGKLREFRALLAPLQIVAPADLNLDIEVEENGQTFLENATLKATAFSAAAGLVALADDSGLEIDALDGAPGIHSARFGGPGLNDRDRCRLALEQLTGVPPARRQARFRCCVTAVGGDGRVIAAEGVCPGRISTEPRGANGFGYDPIFYFSALQRTMAELPPEVKNRISHRAAAIRRIATRLVAGFPDLKAG